MSLPFVVLPRWKHLKFEQNDAWTNVNFSITLFSGDWMVYKGLK
jgi:hypothetical protein